MNLPVLIPLKDGHPISWPVLTGLASQSIAVDLIAVSRPPMDDEEKYSECMHGYFSQAYTRNVLSKSFMGSSVDCSGVACMMDSDVALLSPDILQQAVKKLVDDVDLMVVYIIPCHKTTSNHRDMGCFVAKRKVFEEIDFRSVFSETCNCVKFYEDICSKNMKSFVIDTERAISKIDRTKFGYRN